jgi:hypothetical protein
MPYKIVHVHESGADGTICYDDLDALLTEGWEIEDTKDVTFKGVDGVERYRLKQGPAETGLVAGQHAHGGQVVAQEGGGFFERALTPLSGSPQQQLASALGAAMHHLGPSAAHMIPGCRVMSGNARDMIIQHAADSAYMHRGIEANPFDPDSVEGHEWLECYRKAENLRDNPNERMV